MTSVTIGDVVGSEKPDEYVFFGAHMDTVYNGPGAIDNTVGAVTIIELARQLAKESPKRTIRLCTFGAEEIGIWGSRLYWAAHEAELKDSTKFMFNFDMNHANIATMTLTLLSDDQERLDSLEPYKDQMFKKYRNLRKYTVNYEFRDPFPGNSDHYIFQDNGIPFFVCFGSGSVGYHSYLDNIEQFNAESLSVSAIIYGSYGLNVANR
jgi:Zn-dependent M28 family amino/carboxypeptidase